MEDEKIVKALGICSSEHLGCEDGCPYVEVPCFGGDALLKDALALVKTKDTEIDILIRKNETLKDDNFELKAEVERLKNEIGSLNKAYPCTVQMNDFCVVYARSLDDYDNLIGDISAEGINEVADSLQSILDEHTLQNGDVHFVALYKAVEKLTKELTE